ncbi:MAG: hypothetical protein OXE57_10300 [Alphaproteobacteria bacterium]|nr:hypothetical protein [Alphaproteobacteria bacterium]
MARRRHIERDAAISRALAAGRSVRMVAADYGLAVSTVYGIARREGWTWHRGPRQQLRFCDREGCPRPLPRPGNRFCSHECFVAWRRAHLPACPRCGGKVRRRSSKFCSRLCYRLWLREFWAGTNEDRNRRIVMEARSGTPLTRIAAFHGVSHRTVSKVVNGPGPRGAGVCAAPGCAAQLPRRRSRFCCAACRRAWNEAQEKPPCANGCGARVSRRSGRFCGSRCHAAHAAREARQRNLARDTFIVIAAAAGVSRAEIALRTGLNKGYVSQIVSRPDRRLLPAPDRKEPAGMSSMYILPDDPGCPDCGACMWSRTAPRARECQACGFVQHLETLEEHAERLQREIDAEIASGA